MANIKTSLDFYRVDTNRYQDIRIKRLKKTFRGTGIAVYDYILCEIYRVRGCYIEWDESTVFDVAEYFDMKESQVREIVNYCCAVGLFDKELLANGSVLSSSAIQRRYIEMCTAAKRKVIIIPEKYRILPETSEIITEECKIVPEDCGKEKESKVNNNTPYNPPEGEMPTGKKDKSEESEKPTTSSTDATGSAGNTPPGSAAPPSKGERRAKRFVPPTIEEVAAYCAERKNSVSPAKFINYYTSNGWRVGKNPMKDWRAAVRTWENNNYDNEKRPNTTDKRNAFRGTTTNEVRYGSTTSAKQALLDEITRADREKLSGNTPKEIPLRGEFDDSSFGPEVDLDS